MPPVWISSLTCSLTPARCLVIGSGLTLTRASASALLQAKASVPLDWPSLRSQGVSPHVLHGSCVTCLCRSHTSCLGLIICCKSFQSPRDGSTYPFRVCVHVCVDRHRGDQRTVCKSWFSPSTVCVQGLNTGPQPRWQVPFFTL